MAEQQASSPALIPERAVVLGCGMAGIVAAAALRNHFEDVVVVERDELLEEPMPRRGVPQHAQLHNLLSNAQCNIDYLLPGFTTDLREAGAGDASVSDETHVYELGIRMPERPLGLRLMSARRPLIEHVARQKLRDEGRVSFEGLANVAHLLKSGSYEPGGKVRGVIIERENRQGTIEADLVVDATGSGSMAGRWLTRVYEQAPKFDLEQTEQWYVSTLFDRPAEYIDCNDFWLAFPNPPSTRGGLVSPVSGDKWYVSVSGRKVDKPPRTEQEVKDFAKTIEDDQLISSLIGEAKSCGTPNLFRKINACMRRYDLLDEPLSGFLPIGDAIASLNPLFGQGMSVASQQARGLDSILGEYRQGTLNRRELTSKYISYATDAAQAAWDLGDVINQSVANSTEGVSAGVRYKALAELIKEDPAIHKLYVSIWHLIEPASALQAEEIQQKLDELSL